LVVEIEYSGWSNDGLLRHASFRGLRDDKDAREIVREVHTVVGKQRPPDLPTLSHPERFLWPGEGITKQGLADYYIDSADWIMPHLVGRPLSLVRCPGGIEAECFYAKHGWAGLGDAVRRVETGEAEPMLVVDNVVGLMELVQANVLEIHPWGSATGDLERPDRLIFDLDPGEGVSWSGVIEAAREVRERLRTRLKLESFVKTTGGKGLHVVAPLVPSIDWNQAKATCKELAEAMATDSPRRYVTIMAKSARNGKIFVDYLRNGRGATAVAAYSTRARAGATVSTPLGWDELSDAVRSDHYRLTNIGRRLANLKHDPWAEFFAIKQRVAQSRSITGRGVKTQTSSPKQNGKGK
jgi:bifunctional non-homologous end joining protein LigD